MKNSQKNDKNYSCPPYCGTPEEMEERARTFRYVWVLESSHAVKNALDPVETGALKKQHNQLSRQLMKACRDDLLPQATLSIIAGPCGLCSPCHMAAGEPCPFEEQRSSCLSAYCIDVGKLAIF